MDQQSEQVTDLFIIGGGINGCGIARDASGRGYSVTLAEMDDLASATSSASTKLFHGGLRYLEYFEFRLVKEALIEREILLKAMPHISWAMRFVLPYHKDMLFESDTPASRLLRLVMPWMKGRRPGWLIRLGLFLYDNLGGREVLQGTKTIGLQGTAEGAPLNARFEKAYEYSDCWVEDSRLVALNARDAEMRGAMILTRTKVVSAVREGDLWRIETSNNENGATAIHYARMLVNAAGPWVGNVIHNVARLETKDNVRLVRGSHIVTRKLYDHDKCYFFQGQDGRIIFAIPYETDFTLIGTTDAEHADANDPAVCTEAERDYLIGFANGYFEKQITPGDVVWTYSGVRPLYDDGASSATAATRDYTLRVDRNGAPVLNIFGGKITTYRRLAESALEQINECLQQHNRPWTAGVPLAGGDFDADEFDALVADLLARFEFLDDRWARRLVRAYGTEAQDILAGAETAEDLGRNFGASLTEAEVIWLIEHEFAQTAEDILWRRSKLGLRMTAGEIAALEAWLREEK